MIERLRRDHIFLLGKEFIHDVERERDEKADKVGDADPFVACADGEHFWGHGPGDGC